MARARAEIRVLLGGGEFERGAETVWVLLEAAYGVAEALETPTRSAAFSARSLSISASRAARAMAAARKAVPGAA
jgi:hypothetical protein